MDKLQKKFVGFAALVAVFFLSAAAGWGAIDPSTVQKLVAGDGGWLDSFGSRVSVDGDIAVIGAEVHNAAYVFVRNGVGLWIQQAKLLPNDGAASDYFGRSVSVSGNTAVIGSYKDDDNGANSGSAYVFVRNGVGLWTQQAKLLPNDGAASDYFGGSVSIFGDTVVISASSDDNGSNSGSAYVFVRNGVGLWTQQAKLLPNDGAASDYFGRSVSVSGDTAVIGASGDDDNGSSSGSAYVFVRNGVGLWTQQAKLLPYEVTGNDWFGCSVSVSGDTTVIGAYGDDDNGNQSGAAYIYSSPPTTSDVTVTVTAPTGDSTYNHGNQVTINWETENADPADTMVLSMKRDAASSMAAPDNRSWYRFIENTFNDGTETVTIPDSVVAASDWRFYVRHVASNAYDATDATVTLEEPTNTHKLYVTKTGEGSGSITSNPGSLSCGDACKNTNALFANGETVVLTATPSNCFKLVGWEKCDGVVNDNTCTVTMNGYREAIAQFAPETDTGTLRVVFYPPVPYEAGSVTSDPLGIVATSTDISTEHKFCVGDTVRLTAQASAYPQTIFNGWTIGTTPNNPCNGDQNSNVCDVTITSGMTEIRPSFLLDTTQPYNLHVRVSGLGQGHVTSQWRNLNCGNDGTGTVCDIWLNYGDKDILSAVAAPGSKFVRWSGVGSLDCNGKTDSDCPYTMIWPHEVEAVFSAEDLGVSVSASVDTLVSGIDTSFEVLISNNTDEDSHQTTVDITTMVNEQPYDQLVWQCGDNTGKGTCQKMDQDTFQVMVNGGKSVVIQGNFLEVGQKKIAVAAQLTNSSDANPDNDQDKKELFSDLAALGQPDNMTLLKFHQGQLYGAQERNTIIFTHGWQEFALSGCDAREGIDRLQCYGKELWTGESKNGQAAWLIKRLVEEPSDNKIGSDLNAVQYIWQGAFTGLTLPTLTRYAEAHKNIKTAGNILGKKIVAALGTDYGRKIHLIGHSMGTIVNAYAVRYLLNNMSNSNIKIQMTILDHPNRIYHILDFDISDAIPLISFHGYSRKKKFVETYRFDQDWFAELLPEIDDPSYRNKLLVENYFAEEKLNDTGLVTAGVGTPITGGNVYNHETKTGEGLHDPNDMGNTLFTAEGLFNNDHSGVQQWYRWTMWPSQKDGLFDHDFVCTNRRWVAIGAGDSPDHESLDPCESGFAFSILQNNPQPFPKDRNGESLRERKVTTAAVIEGSTSEKDCTIDPQSGATSCSGASQPSPQSLKMEESAASLFSAETIDTAASYAAMEINVSHDSDRISFEYQFNNNVENEYVHLLLDGRIVWSLDETAAENGEWEQTGKIPVVLKRGMHHLMLVYNQQTDTSSFAMRELQFFEAPNKNGFLPAMLFLLLNK
ncbi:MAG: hypothetical protein D3913_08045 [Candidatus Electrothrix sp. LOE1_4_5]|nr:hypothetical protein [Candidatus Electrothrix gigas]